MTDPDAQRKCFISPEEPSVHTSTSLVSEVTHGTSWFYELEQMLAHNLLTYCVHNKWNLAIINWS